MNSLTQSLRAEHARIPLAATIVLSMLKQLRHGRLELTTPEGETLTFSGDAPGPHARLILHDWSVFGQALSRGDIGFAEAYRADNWETPEPGDLITLAALNQETLHQALNGRSWRRWPYRLLHQLRRNSRAGSRRNIHAHYDVGNAFYRLWLDHGMNYSAGLFDGGRDDLFAAQRAKHERILQRLDVRPEDHILEIGCGWGGFAEYAARTRGCRVTGITLSTEQLTWARERIESAGLGSLVDFQLRDYRDVESHFDHIVSIEMLEAVGEAYWPTYFDIIRSRLRDGGRALVQTITIDDANFESYRRDTDFIQQYIFPGGMLPSPERLNEVTAGCGLRIVDQYAFGPNYARTLQCWRARFELLLDEVRALGYDEEFIRIWRFYLAYCEAGFRIGRTDVMQLEIRHA